MSFIADIRQFETEAVKFKQNLQKKNTLIHIIVK